MKFLLIHLEEVATLKCHHCQRRWIHRLSMSWGKWSNTKRAIRLYQVISSEKRCARRMCASSIGLEKQFAYSITETYSLTRRYQFTNRQKLCSVSSDEHLTLLLLNSTITRWFCVLCLADCVTLVKPLKFWTYLNFFNVFLKFISERERQGQGAERERGRHRIQSRLQALSCQPRVRRGAETHEPWDHDLSPSWPLNWLSHPGAPKNV